MSAAAPPHFDGIYIYDRLAGYNNAMNKILVFLLLLGGMWHTPCFAQAETPAKFRVLAFYENGGHHMAYSARAVEWLNKLAADSNFTIDYRQDTDDFTGDFLAQYQLLIQLDFVPYGWKSDARQAFIQYIEQGVGGWVGFHHATLLGDFDGYSMWPWFSQFMGGIRYKNYIPNFAAGEVYVEAPGHPIFQGVPRQFAIQREEWYTYDRSPRPNVRVLAHVDERSYVPDTVDVRMGDHPVIWTNEAVKARNVYIFMGHGPDLFDNPAYVTLVKNAVFWAAGKR